MYRLTIRFTNGRSFSVDIPDMTVAHEIRRSFSVRFVADWSVSPILVA